ncbi:MAG: aldehyde dehydrogenase family protein [Naasia sp.]|nr:aldehyde dehydrogenase family protein [Naasia sp.]
MSEGAAVVGRLRAAYESGITKPYAWRVAQLRALRRMLDEEEDAFEAALLADLGKHPVESVVTEIGLVRLEIDHVLKHLRGWLRPRRVPVPAIALPATARTMYEPLGVALVIAPWNYPVLLSLSPAIGALAAGNALVLKPSELAPATSALLAELLPARLDRRAVAVVEGGVPQTTDLLEQRFDTIFYTGNGRVGRIVAAAAAKQLTPVTLELGGKSPVYVDGTGDLRAAAERIVWGKFLNAGQTCVAPDYLLATADVAARLVPLLREAVLARYGEHPESNPDYARIPDERRFDRLLPLLADGDAAVGGTADRGRLHVAPTVLTGVARDAPIMQEEIFGPILPLIEVTGLDDAIRFVNAGDKPLALYVFSTDRAVRRAWLTRTSSGAVGFDAPNVHLSVPGLPFGGVGGSGTGAYHGERSLRVFSHEKAVFAKPLAPDTLALFRPPYTERVEAIVRRIFR